MTEPRRILITGGTSGVGLATARRLAAAGPCRIVLNGRDAGRGAAACAALRALRPDGHAAFVAADVSDAESVAQLVATAARELDGPIDVLVNSAGGDFLPTLFHDTAPADIDGIVRTWLLGTMLVCRHALPHLRDGAAIVNVASDAAKVPTPGEAAIGAVMAGIAMFSRTLAMEGKRRGLRVNVVAPSLIDGTPTSARVTAGGFSARLFAKAAKAAHLGLPTAEDVAAMVAFLAGPDAARVTGQVVSVNGGISAG